MEQSTIASGNRQPFFMEHRWGQRIPCRARVRLSANTRISGEGRVRDVSSSGAFIETAVELPVGTPLILLVVGELPTLGAEVAATVVRTQSDGVGVEWCETPVGSPCSMLGCSTRCATNHP